ncbi:Thioredoxin [Ruminococcaceae bacterium YRB3002]|nr:Thioredoxin [Ruminococcaceae bacterium YRB3002]
MQRSRRSDRLICVPLILAFLFCILTGCSSGASEPSASAASSGIDSFTGGYDYEAPVSVLVYEPVEGEDECGIQYRAVTDVDGLIASDNKIMFYFYNSMATELLGITAGVEDMAQACWGDMYVVVVDVMEDPELSARYSINSVPEFVVVRGGDEISRFEGYNYEEWSLDDVVSWLEGCGTKFDYTRLQ